MLFSAGDNESSPPESPDPLAVAVPSSDHTPPGDGTNREPDEGAAPASDPPHHRDNFSIREYVFRSRSKDIYRNWPFSRKDLQLCLQHGVTEVLPPFQHLDVMKCQSFEILKFENRSFVGKDSVADFQSVPSSSKSKVPSPECAAELTVDGAASSEKLSLVRSPAKCSVPLVTLATRVSRASTEQLPVKTAIPLASSKSGSLARATGKKCRLIVKFGAKSERSSGDDAASNCTSVSENMGSKVCPVCKTFSSSSNTTLNAHIDQCLSLGSMPKGLVMRHRIKPRKTRLMVDIYETAKRCTIEELNRRNGLSWANSLTVASSTVDAASGEERRPCRQMVRAGDLSDAGAVYIDANGTKLRILSKFNDAPAKLGCAKDARLKKSLLVNTGFGIFKKKTKKLRGQTRYKYLKLASKRRKFRSMKSHDSQFLEQKNLRRMHEDGEGSQGHSQWSQRPVKPGVSGILRQRSSSKRTGLKMKIAVNVAENSQRRQLHLVQDSLDENDRTSLVRRMPIRSRSFSRLDSSGNSVYSQSFDYEKERSWPDRLSLEREEPGVSKRSLAWSDVTTDSIEKWGFQKLPKDNHFQEVNRPNIRKPAGHNESPFGWKKGVDIHAIIGGGRELRPRSFSRKALRFSTLRKRALSLCHSSENSSDVSVGQREFFCKKPIQQLAGGMHHLIEDLSQGRSVEEDTDFEVSPCDSCERERTGLPQVAKSSGVSEKVRDTKLALNDTFDAKTSGDAVEGCMWGLSEYYDSACLNFSDGSWTNSRSQQFLGISNESLRGIEEDFSRAYNACDVGNEENANRKTDVGFGVGQSSTFTEIDPIPIPGPPGSFLPSPGAMGSDDFQGISSLTTSQAQSSHDHQDINDGYASDSPPCTTSTVSNSAEAKWGLDYSEDLESVTRPLLPENPWTGFSSAGNDGSSIQQSASAAPLSTFPETIGRDGDGKKANNVFIKKDPPVSRYDDEPCCCQKDRAVSQSGVLDYREMRPRSLRRQTGQDQILTVASRPEVGSEGSIAEAPNSLIMSSSRGLGELLNGSDHVDCDFPSPSGSNPVLRLMGKDLIVVNKEEDAATMLNQSLSTAPSPAKIQDSLHGVPLDGGQNQKEYCYKDADYSPVPSFFMGSSNGYLGITLPMTVQPPKLVPKLACNGVGSRLSGQFESMMVEQVGPSKQTMTTAVAPICPKELLVIDDAYGRNSGPTSSSVHNGNLPQDAVLLPQGPASASRGTSTALPTIYQPRETSIPCEPVAELACSHPKVTGFHNTNSGQDEDGHLLPPAPSFATAPQFLGHPRSGFVYYPSFW